MSIMRCDLCGWVVDSDDDPECIRESYNPSAGKISVVVACARCREQEALDEYGEEERARWEHGEIK